MIKLHRSPAEKEKKELSLLSPKPNFEKIVFYLLVLLLPTQFGKHFWPAFSQVLGIRVDYLSPTLYATDIVILILFVLWLKRLINYTRQAKTPNNPSYYLRLLTCHSRERGNPVVINNISLLIFFIYLVLNIVLSSNFLLGLYGFIKVLEFFFLGCYVSQNLKTKKELAIIALISSITVIGESLLAIGQYTHQSSLNGFLYFLGERKFTSLTPGIANASINGELILRPYGTFPHPNVLAGFLLCSLIIIFAWFEDKKDTKKKLLKIISLLLGSIALFLTLSRIAILLWFILVIIVSAIGLIKQIKIQKKTSILVRVYALFISAIIIGLFFFTPILPRLEGTSFKEEAITQRAELFKSTLIIIKDHPLFGVGLLNFLPSLSHIQKPLSPTLYLQPVHNIFLLTTAEIGIIGTAFFFWFLFKTYKRLLFYLSLRGGTTKQSLSILLILSVILILGLFDHYWLTLQQGQLLFALILGLSWAL